MSTQPTKRAVKPTEKATWAATEATWAAADVTSSRSKKRKNVTSTPASSDSDTPVSRKTQKAAHPPATEQAFRAPPSNPDDDEVVISTESHRDRSPSVIELDGPETAEAELSMSTVSLLTFKRIDLFSCRQNDYKKIGPHTYMHSSSRHLLSVRFRVDVSTSSNALHVGAEPPYGGTWIRRMQSPLVTCGNMSRPVGETRLLMPPMKPKMLGKSVLKL